MKRFLLIGILVLAAVIRLYAISSIPPSLSWDEAAIGYDAYSISETGRDQWGVKFPLAFKSFGEYKYPFHIYITSLFVKIFGLNEFSVRFGSALFGIVNIFLLYILVKKLFKDEKIALLSSFFLAISPWHIQFSRVSWETNYALFFFLLALCLFYLFIENEKKKYYIVPSFFLFGMTLFTYNALKVFIPLFLAALCLVYFRKLFKNKRIVIVSLAIFILFLVFNLTQVGLSGISRFSQLTFTESQVVDTQVYKLTRVYKLGWINVLVNQYFSHFSLKFLFISGDPNPRHSIQTVGQLLWFDLLFIPIGLYTLIKKRDKISILLLIWFFIAPIPASIAREAPHASRAMMALGGWQIVSAVGVISIISLKYKKLLALCLLPLIAVPLLIYLKSYFKDYSQKYSQYWQYGYKDVAYFIKQNYDNYQTIYVTRKYGEPQIFLLFYLKYPPNKYQTDPNLKREKVGDWIKVFKFDKFQFLEEDEIKDIYKNVKERKGKILIVGSRGDFSDSAKTLKEINFLDGSSAFQIVEI